MKKLQSIMKPGWHLGASWRLVVLILIAALIVTAQQNSSGNSPQVQNQSTKSSTDANQIIVNTDLVTLNVTVIDSQGFAVTGLEKKHFALTDDKHPQEIMFFSDADLPLSVGIVFDVSGSMKGEKFERAKEALSEFIQTGHPEDEYFLIGFNSQPQLLLDGSRDSDAITRKLSFLEPQSSTALYDAAYLARDRVLSGVHVKRAIVIISDGQDNNSRYSFSQLRRAFKESDVVIYAIGIQGPTPGDALDFFGKMLLSKLAGSSGGRALFPADSTALTEALEGIALELRHQYSIGYRPSNFTLDGKWHRIKVKVTTPNKLKRVYVRHREGYYATAPTR